MRTPRMILKGEEQVQYCYTRLKDGIDGFSTEDRGYIKDAILKYCGFYRILLYTYSISSRFFEMMVRMPGPHAISDKELLRSVKRLYGSIKADRLHKSIKAYTGKKGDKHDPRPEYTRLMYNLSNLMKNLKVTIANIYNSNHGSRGSIWSTRFTNRMVEDRKTVLADNAAYVDASPAVHGECTGPEKYRFCGIGDAVQGTRLFRDRIIEITGAGSWKKALRTYLKLVKAKIDEPRGDYRPTVLGNLDRNEILKKVRKNIDKIPVVGKKADELFKDRIRILTKYKKRFGHCNVPKNWPENRLLGQWLCSQRVKKRKGVLAPWKQKILENMGVSWKLKRGRKRGAAGLKIWEEMYRRYAEYTRDTKDPIFKGKDIQLGQWASVQRHTRKEGRLTETQIKKLNNIGFIWDIKEYRWGKMYEKLIRFKKKHGHCQVPVRYEQDSKLGRWVMTQRGDRRKGILSEKRVEKLDKAGLKWDPWRKDY